MSEPARTICIPPGQRHVDEKIPRERPSHAPHPFPSPCAELPPRLFVSLLVSPVGPLLEAQAPGAKPAAAPAAAPRPRKAGRAPIRRRAARHSSSTSRRSRAGWIRNTRSSTRRCRTRRRARTSPRSAPSRRKPHQLALDDRLVSFSDLKIAESDFPTFPREQLKTVLAEIAASVPLDERVIALDRVLANIDSSQSYPRTSRA